ncbi:MAG: hypothetical protein ACI4UM_08005 [Succinivibrio sp.]
MADNRIIADNGGSTLIIEGIRNFSDKLGSSSFLNLIFMNGSGKISECIAKDITYKGSRIEIRLPASVNNELAYRAKSCSHRFTLRFAEVDSSGNALGSTLTSEVIALGNFTIVKEQAVSEITEVKEESIIAPVNDPPLAQQSKNKGSALKFVIAGVAAFLLLLAVAFLAWLLLFNSNSSDETQESMEAQESAVQESVPEKDEEPAAEVAAKTLSDESYGAEKSSATVGVCRISSDTDAVIIKNCLASTPDTTAVLNLAEEALSKNRCELGKRLLSAYGRRDSKVSLIFAKYYNANEQKESSCIAKDKAQAIYWYEKSAALGNQEAADALTGLKK